MNLKSEIAKRIGVAIILSSFWPLYNVVLRILLVILIAALIGSCIILWFGSRLSHPRWKKLKEAANFEVTFAALSLAMITSGVRLVTNELIWWGVIYIVAGAFFIGAGIGDNIALSTMGKKPKIITAIVFSCFFILVGLLNLI
ncbi:MAG: hypothetical protein MUO17_03140 [Dehalococcoidales bacterium]|nr:hypothetical protein [Dehalococcoidales bacterium]